MTETEVIKKGKPAIFWIFSTSVIWVILGVLCNSLIFLWIGKDSEVQKVILQKFNSNAGIEVEVPKSDSEAQLEKDLEEIKDKLSTCTIELEVLSRVCTAASVPVNIDPIPTTQEPTVAPEIENLED